MTCSSSPDGPRGPHPQILNHRLANAFDIAAGDQPALGVAVSGGSDSLALLVAAHAWGQARRRRIEAATVDHGLRPEAAAEARTVGAICAHLGVPHTTLTWRPEPGRHIAQAAARSARHRLLAGWAASRDLRAVALGHTRDDRIETFLLRVRAGSGWYGLSGPLPVSASPVWPEGRNLLLVRPLLAFARADLRADLSSRNLAWIEDPSNQMTKHERVRMRALAARLTPSTQDRIIAAMDRFARLRANIMAGALMALADLHPGAPSARLALPASPETSLRLLEALVMAAGGREAPPRRDALIRLADRIRAGALGRGATLSGALLRPAAPAPGEASSAWVVLSQAPPRRGARPSEAPDWDRARARLANPRVELLGV